jgi:hypothetical protein
VRTTWETIGFRMKNGLHITDDGTKAWYLNGNYHREGGPAIESAYGNKAWYLNGKPHREDGPAVEYANGDKAWWLNGKEITIRPMTAERLQKIALLI